MPHTPTLDDASDSAWADPAWQVDSTTHPCCNAIGGEHSRTCIAPYSIAVIATDEDAGLRVQVDRSDDTVIIVPQSGAMPLDMTAAMARNLSTALLAAADQLDAGQFAFVPADQFGEWWASVDNTTD